MSYRWLGDAGSEDGEGDAGLRLPGIKKGNEKEIWAPGTSYLGQRCATVRLLGCGKSPWAFLKDIVTSVICLSHM